MSRPVVVARMTEAEYLAYDLAHEGKHEFVNGEVLAMAGATYAHNVIQANVLGILWNFLRGGPCRVHGSDMRVRLDETGLYCYPDVTVVCGEAQLATTTPETLLNPCVIIEVLSESTEDYDRGAKLAHYRHRVSVHTVLLVDSQRRLVERQSRNPNGTWTLSEHVAGTVHVLDVAADHDVLLDDIYGGVAAL